MGRDWTPQEMYMRDKYTKEEFGFLDIKFHYSDSISVETVEVKRQNEKS